MQEKWPLNSIARAIGVHPSTVAREIKRNSGKNGQYFPEHAEELAMDRAERLPGNRKTPDWIVRKVVDRIVTEEWSPRQISGWLANQGISLSHETIYKLIREDESGVLRQHCRHRMKHLKRRIGADARTSIPDRVSIHSRPPEADGSRFGDWEADLIVGKDGKGAILTLCERSVNYMMMTKLPHGKTAEGVADAMIELLWPYRKNVLTITVDNGSEFSCHKRVAKELSTKVYFADPYSSWQKGAIENTNKLIRQYIPKKTDFKNLSDDFVLNVQYKINRRPREKLNFSTPKDRFFKLLL